ncbi:napD family protein [Paraburkholderia xenovorans LB400]|uniref:Chaperone NapD n=1 Tax=Paraburkholderia xenovorans (strain LB400) TaxID=266265 RepID=Q13I16_PARXL|nr:chaperone NapD [Paraburkholderia xenovorans]ABE36273.1 periplasmic nitrate reductase chaperone NapD [Paraburkholderia xenovorans LB400]AIP34487.1 napD family protein [Paraburkholderia xenovorans LB400]
MPVVNGSTVTTVVTGDELHIAGIVVHVQPRRIAGVRQAIGMLPGAEIHAISELGKLVVTLEGGTASEVAEQLHAIHALPGVYSAALVYQHHEDIESLNEELADDAVPSRVY